MRVLTEGGAAATGGQHGEQGAEASSARAAGTAHAAAATSGRWAEQRTARSNTDNVRQREGGVRLGREKKGRRGEGEGERLGNTERVCACARVFVFVCVCVSECGQIV